MGNSERSTELKVPKWAYVSVCCRVPVKEFVTPGDMDEFTRGDYTREEILNDLETWLRDSLWEYIPDNKIKIEFD